MQSPRCSRCSKSIKFVLRRHNVVVIVSCGGCMQAAGLKDKLLRSHAEMTNLADRHRKEKENLQNYAVQVHITLLGDTLPAFETRIHACAAAVLVGVILLPWC